MAGEIQERLPVVKNGLQAFFPFDGPGGAFDIIGGRQATQSVENGVNLVEAMQQNWRDPNSWSVSSGVTWDEDKQALRIAGYKAMALKTPIVVDPSKRYEILFEVMIEERSTHASGEGLLYLGGFSDNKDNVKATRNYDYTIASGNRPVLGQWTTFRLTRTGTALAGNGTSYSYDTVKGWTGDQTPENLADRLIKYYYMGGLFNYSSGGVMYIRNMRMAVVSNDTSNTTLLETGIAVQNSTTNLCVADGQGTSSPWGGDGSPSLNIIDPEVRFRGRKVVRFRTGTSGNCYLNGSGDINSGVNSTTFTFSVYAKRADGKPISGVNTYLYVAGNANDNQAATHIEEVEDGWYRIVRTRTGLVSGGVSLTGCYNLGTDTEYLLADWQVETRAWATHRTWGTRPNGSLYLDGLGGYTNYTICGEVILDETFKNNGGYVESPASGAYLFALYDTVNTGYIGYRYWENGSGISGPYLNRSGTYGTGNIHHYYELSAKKPTYFMVRKSGTTFEFKFYQDGWRNTHTTTVDAGARLDDFRMGNSTIMNATYSNISVYNRALSDAEVDKNRKSTFSFSKEGNVTTVVKETSVNSDDGTRFPFGSDAHSEGGGIKAVETTNEAYSKSSLWVGDPTTNYGTKEHLSPYLGYSTCEWVGNTIRRVTTNTNGVLVMRSTPLYPEQGKTISVSGYMYVNGKPVDYKASSGGRITTYSGYTTTYMESDASTGYFEATVVVDAAATSGWLFHSTAPAKTIGDVLTIEELQIEEKGFPTAYVNGGRGKSRVVIPYNVVDCKTDFTISGWFYPKIFGDGSYRPFLTRNRITSNMTSQRILIMGSSTSSRTLGCWFGSGGTETTLNAPTSVQVQDNAWNFFCLRRSGNTVSFFLGVNGKIAYSTSSNGAYLNTDEPASTWGWLVGEYSGSMANGYARDYVFRQKALSDEEITAIFRTQIRSHQGGSLEVQGQVKEGKVL